MFPKTTLSLNRRRPSIEETLATNQSIRKRGIGPSYLESAAGVGGGSLGREGWKIVSGEKYKKKSATHARGLEKKVGVGGYADNTD